MTTTPTNIRVELEDKFAALITRWFKGDRVEYELCYLVANNSDTILAALRGQGEALSDLLSQASACSLHGPRRCIEIQFGSDRIAGKAFAALPPLASQTGADDGR